MVEGVDSEDQQTPGEEPVALNGMPVEAEADQGTPMFRAVEVVEMSRRQQNIARQIVLQMEGKGPFGIVDGAISGHGVLRKILPMLWELPMSSEGEYDGVTVLKFLEQGVPAGCGGCEPGVPARLPHAGGGGGAAAARAAAAAEAGRAGGLAPGAGSPGH